MKIRYHRTGAVRSRSGSDSMKVHSKALAALAVAAIVCICPAIVMADGSDAYTRTDGESALSFEIESMTAEQTAKFLSTGQQTTYAQEVVDKIVYNYSYFDLDDISVKDVSYKNGAAYSIDGDDVKSYSGDELKFTISFTATSKSVGELLTNDKAYVPLMKALGNNARAIGDKLEITAEVTMQNSDNGSAKYIATDAGDFVMTESSGESYQCTDMDITAKFTRASDSSTVTFEVESEFEQNVYSDIAFDFNGTDASEVTATTIAYETNDTSLVASTYLKCSVGDDSESTSVIYKSPHHNGSADYAPLHGEDLEVPAINYVDGTGTTLIYGISFGDSDLYTESGFTAFLTEVGASTSTDYSDAKEIADDTYGTVVDEETMALGILGIAVGALVLLVIVLIVVIVIILIVKRKKN